ncbi:hypothetical protein Dimus_038859 [Dionaea muscipula]
MQTYRLNHSKTCFQTNLRMVHTRTGARFSDAPEDIPSGSRLPSRPSTDKGKGHAVAEGLGVTPDRLPREEWDMVRQMRIQRASPFSPEEVHEVEDVHVRRPDPVMLVHHDEDLQGKMFERFMGTQPIKFFGTVDAVKASNWLYQTERILGNIGCPIEHWVSLAAYMLKEAALYWW